MKSFPFQGHTFSPVRQLNANEKNDRHPQSAKMNYAIQLPKLTAKPVLKDRESGWDYDRFYQAAQQAGAGEIDLFQVEGQGETLYLPTTAYLSILPGAR